MNQDFLGVDFGTILRWLGVKGFITLALFIRFHYLIQ